ncbi:DNA helicase RecQ [Aliikangiella sp. IMCC44359]|uniref:DNA helicase RecQ n=1 Tax=Aliikangiella sp. IMCC44359 TaxID=3459125 RepID=UPI00403B1CBD
MQRAQQLLSKTFGYQAFRLNQADIIQALLNGHDVLALMPTGGGKSLCYQIPALVRNGAGIVISPLIALMQDQVDALQLNGVNAAFLNSTLTHTQIYETEQALLNGEIDLLYVAPERLLTAQCLELLSKIPLSLFAIDEAHCVSQWGHDFRPEYQRLSILHQNFPHVPRIALTATADKRTREEIITQLNLTDATQFINSFDRANIRYVINEGQNSREQLWRFIKNDYADESGIVYCLSRNKVESTAEWLTQKGRTALPYHAGLSAEIRQQHQQRFLREQGIIIVATIAFGMGIDKPDVRFVAHLSLPKSIEAYYQETGRAGRDGQPATAWMAYGLQDVITLRQMMQQSTAEETYKIISQQKLEAMLGLCELITCRRQSLLAYFDEVLSEPCGNCDNCLTPPQTWDASVAAQKALSCVYRTGQRFGIAYLVDVLLGKSDERILNNQHDQLSTYGLGKELSVAEWRSLFRQLIAQGYIFADHENFGAIKLTELCRALLRGEETLLARKLTKSTKKEKVIKKQVSVIHQSLLSELKALRKTLADEQGLPPYVIFHDATLIQMVETRPSQLSEMRFINGVGERKLAQYGAEFLAIIKAHQLPDIINPQFTDTVNQSLFLYAQAMSVEQIAHERGLSQDTIYGHLAEAIKVGALDPMEVLPIESEDYQLITHTLLTIPQQTPGRLKSVYKTLGEEFSYGVIRCIDSAEINPVD